jgi:TonB family protein
MKLHFTTLAILISLTACATQDQRYRVGSNSNLLIKDEAETSHRELPPFVSDQAISPARVLSSTLPDYPQNLRDANIEGTVVVRFVVEVDGAVSNPSVSGSPPAELAEISRRTIARWKFSPATRDGVPVRVLVEQRFLFKIE